MPTTTQPSPARFTDARGLTRNQDCAIVMVDGDADVFGPALPKAGPWIPHFAGGATNYPHVRREGDDVLWHDEGRITREIGAAAQPTHIDVLAGFANVVRCSACNTIH